MRYEEVIHRCFRCGYCKFTRNYYDFNCPSYLKYKFDTFSPGGRMWLIRAWLKGEIKNSPRLQEIFFSCATCANCVECCPFQFSEDLVEIFIAAKEEMVNSGIVPPQVRDYLKNIYTYGNPYKAPADERDRWAEDLPIETYEGHEYLFYVGCVGSYDERGRKIAKAVANLLIKAGLSMGIMRNQEICDGNEVRALGDLELFRHLAQRNIRLFKERGVKKIVTLDPHAFNAFKNHYKELGGNFQVHHYSQILAPLVNSGVFPLGRLEARVAFHDSCYLGRHNGEYQSPRAILRAIPGVELVELERNSENALCCGGGGGNFFTDILGGGENHPSRIRIKEALESGVSILAVTCPQCAKMLEDAAKAIGVDEELEILDVAEVVERAIGP